MAKYVLLSDPTLGRDYRDFPLLDFLPCAPSDKVPSTIYKYLTGRSQSSGDGRAAVAPYAIRKVEAALRRKYGPEEVVVAHPSHAERFIDDETEIVGVNTMDPLGIAPLTVSYAVFFDSIGPPYVKLEFEGLMRRINQARKGRKAKLLVGGPGVWEFTVLPEEMERLGIDYCFQGEGDDIMCDLFEYVQSGPRERTEFFRGFQTFDGDFHKEFVDDERFISRYRFSKQFPALEDIPEIMGPTTKGLVEVMRGCGIGCDFCEVTLRPLRYCSPERVCREVSVNTRAGFSNAWLHSDEIFAYQHGRNFVPNSEEIGRLMGAVMAVPGVERMSPTHGRISIPAAYPELLKMISKFAHASPDNWIGLQVGVETGSDSLAKIHMPNKTLPLKVGPDGSWADIVWRGTYVMNKYYWRPAFTVQVGQASETSEDNWDTVALINRLSNSELDDGRPFEFTITPMQNVPLGLIKSRKPGALRLDHSQLAVYYACYRHLQKMVVRNAVRDARENLFAKVSTGLMLRAGGWALFRQVSRICARRGLDLEKVARYGLQEKAPQAPVIASLQH